MSPLTPAERLAVAGAIQDLDPDRRYVELDLESGSVKYADDIVQHEHISTAHTDEELVRAYVIAWLCTEGGYLPTNIELEKRYSIGRPKARKFGEGAELDILVKHPDGTSYALMELKAPDDFDKDADRYIRGQLFNIAPLEPGCSVLCYATLRVSGEESVAIRCLSIPYSAGLTFDVWAKSRVTSDQMPGNYGEASHTHYTRGGTRDLRRSATRQELDRIRKRLHDVLWGGTKDDNLVYEYVVKLLLTKIYDELATDLGTDYAFQIRFTGSQREAPRETFDRVNSRYIEAYRRYIADSSSTRVEPLSHRQFSREQIAFVVELLQDISITEAGQQSGDLLGSFFEAITRDGFKQSKGLFFTHYNLAVFMLEVLGIRTLAETQLLTSKHPNEALPYIIDPACGSGTFLLAAMRTITDHITARRNDLGTSAYRASELDSRFPPESPHRWAKDFIYGLEVREDLAISSKVNMVMHQDGHTHIFRADGLAPLSRYADQRLKGTLLRNNTGYSKEVTSSFDVVITNPPFSITLDELTRASLASTFELGSQKNSENVFLERWYQLLKPGGRLGAVMPESFFATAENLSARLFLFAHFHIRAVVSLPSHAFEPWTPTRTSLLFAQKKTAAEEGAWVTAYAEALRTVEDTLRKAKSRVRTLTLERATPLDPKIAETAFAELLVACTELNVPLPADTSVADSVTLLAIKNAIRTVKPEVVAFRRVVPKFEGRWSAATVSQIGYKRTKRAEYDRPNELFSARQVDGGFAVPNVSHVYEPWQIDLSDPPADVLSALLLEAGDLWS